MPNQQVRQSLESLREAMETKGFEDLYVTHYEDTPSGDVVLHDDHGLLARGDHDQIIRLIEQADDVDSLWSALDRANLTRNSLAGKS
jgi:hypothetical protein